MSIIKVMRDLHPVFEFLWNAGWAVVVVFSIVRDESRREYQVVVTYIQ